MRWHCVHRDISALPVALCLRPGTFRRGCGRRPVIGSVDSHAHHGRQVCGALAQTTIVKEKIKVRLSRPIPQCQACFRYSLSAALLREVLHWCMEVRMWSLYCFVLDCYETPFHLFTLLWVVFGELKAECTRDPCMIALHCSFAGHRA